MTEQPPVQTRAAIALARQRSRVESMMANLGLPMPGKPSMTQQLEFPADLGAVSSDDLSTQLTYWSGYSSYAKAQASILDGAATIAEVDLQNTFDAAYHDSREEQVTNKKHSTGALRSVQDKRRLAAELRADATFMAALCAAYDQRYNACSREISRRSAERGIS